MTNVLVMTRVGQDSLSLADRRSLAQVSDLRFVRRQAPPRPREAATLLRDVDVLVTTNACLPTFDQTLLAQCPRLRELVLFSTGHDHVDCALLARHGVVLTTLPDYATQAVAEHALALILASATRLVLANDRSTGRAPETTSLRGIELAGRQLAVIGTGLIGRRLASLAAGIGMRVSGCDIDPTARHGALAQGIVVDTLRDVIQGADVVAVCASTVPRTGPIIDAELLKLISPSAFLINVARPGRVDTPAVVNSIRAGRLRGYAVDAMVLNRREHRDLIAQGRVIQSGHSAWWRDESLARGQAALGKAALAAAQARSRELACAGAVSA